MTLQKDPSLELYKKIITDSVKTKQLNLLEYSYLSNYDLDNGTLINSKYFLELIKKIDNKELDEIINNKLNYLYDDEKKFKKKIILEKKAIIKFTKNQQQAITQIYNFLSNYNVNIFGLYGYAGTGKTTTIIEIISYLIKNKFINSVVFTAPTNKAVSVLKSKFRPYIENIYKEYCNDNKIKFEEQLDSLYEKNIKIGFTTIHKLLSIEIDFGSDGDLIFIRGNGSTLINHYELIIVDECSMLPIKLIDIILFEINKITNKNGNKYKRIPKFIFCGDPAQLPPVNETNSAIFINDIQQLSLLQYINGLNNNNTKTTKSDIIQYDNKYQSFIHNIINMETITLTQVMRSKIDAVTQVCYEIRLWLLNEKKDPELKKFIGEYGVYFFNYTKNSCKLKSEWFIKCYEKYQTGIMNNIIITWTNKQADIYNQAIRKLIFKKQKLDRFEINEILILNDFYNFDENKDNKKNNTKESKDEKENKFYTSEQIKVIKIKLVNRNIDDFPIALNPNILQQKNGNKFNGHYKQTITDIHNMINKQYLCWKLYVQKISNDTEIIDDTIYTLYVIHENSEKKMSSDKDVCSVYIKKLRTLLNNKYAQAEYIEKYIIKQLWKEWHKKFNEPYAHINYGYAITCHKGQGSNFYNVFVDVDDICKNNNIEEMKKCIYTATTRTVNELYLLLS
jgi:hypothetical protein